MEVPAVVFHVQVLKKIQMMGLRFEERKPQGVVTALCLFAFPMDLDIDLIFRIFLRVITWWVVCRHPGNYNMCNIHGRLLIGHLNEAT